ncbi:hypothetical protein GPK34_05285 [Secundilactobacillus kimchicus]|uniref:DUF2187 domain-containing protein n=1 Tax=Secundilactobacillus kimchicus JCM 15530 TaxID=1302272 RepID=A0A0R1HQT4_9LACO|nr:hypothetical protein [Secundilactobacillus kimchicus]KRK47961.1 hypothetical protein FC96_GL002168 [Secundilactobacillus kimchicus JCM 15530]MBT9671436.1 hypothetical protein [Secundilactobacillus kimchicus]
MFVQKIMTGDFVKCSQDDQFKQPFFGRVCRVIGQQAVVEVLNFHFTDRQIVSTNDFYVTIPTKNLRRVKITKCQRPDLSS